MLVVALVLAAVGPASAGAFPSFGTLVQSAKTKAKPCKASERKQTIKYTSRKKKQSVTACIPRSWATKPTLREGRALVLKMAPTPIAKLLRSKAAKRVSAADSILDRAIAAAVVPPAGSRVEQARLHAAAVTHPGQGSETVRSPPGTTTVQTYTSTDWSASEPNPGTDQEIVIETNGRGSSKTSTYKLLKTMSQCPDAGGIGRGVIKFSMRETHVIDTPGGGHGVTDVLTTYDAEVLVHFNDGAAVESVEVKGDWSFENETRMSPRRGAREQRLERWAAGGPVTGSTGSDGRNANVSTPVNNATSAGAAVGGLLYGAIAGAIVDQVPGELVRDSAGRARSGACAKIVPDPLTVHVKPGQSVELTAALNDGGGAALPGTIKAVAAQASVSPDGAQADPTARFTYNALSVSPPGKTDTVTFNHVSKRGLANAKTATVIYDEPPPLPYRFDGTWTRIVVTGGLTETFHGTAAYVKNPFFGPEHPGTEEGSVPYIVESASVDWSVSGSDSGAGCTHTYSGSGTEVYSANWGGAGTSGTSLDLQDIRRGAGAPASEPQPYNYAIRATGDPDNGPKYDTNRSGNCSGHTTTEVSIDYLKIGWPTYHPDDPPPLRPFEWSDSAVLLEGHRFTDEGGGFTIDDTWRFTGSG